MLGRHALAVLGDLDRHARSLAAKPVSVRARRCKCQQVGACLAGRLGRRAAVGCTLSKHQLLAVLGGVLGSVDDQLLAACWRARHMFSELPGSKKGSKIRLVKVVKAVKAEKAVKVVVVE